MVLFLFIPTVFNGYLTKEIFTGVGLTSTWWASPLEVEFYPSLGVKLLPLVGGALALGVGSLGLTSFEHPFGWFVFFSKRGGLDILDGYLTRIWVKFCYYFYLNFERGWLEFFSTRGVVGVTHQMYRWFHQPGWFTYFLAFTGLGLALFSFFADPSALLTAVTLWSYNEIQDEKKN